jgi:glycerol uptake facilitator-like aquaporin
MDKPSHLEIFLSESIGTFILASAINFSASYYSGQAGNLFAIFAGFFLAVTVTREISGGHINPGVSLTVLLSSEEEARKKNIHNILYYILAQLLGAFTAPILSYLLYNQNMFKLDISNSSTSFNAFLIEIIGSIIFYTAILIQGGQKFGDNEKTLSTLTVAFGLLAGIAVSCNISGGGLNPAIAIGFQLSRCIVMGDLSELSHTWLYVFGPLIASYLSSSLYHYIYNHQRSDKKEPLLAEKLKN